MDGDAKGREGRGACIAGQAFSPGETPMSPLCPSDDVFVGHRRWFLRGSGLHHDNCFAPEHLEPVAADVTTGPVSPKDRGVRECFSGFRGRRRRGDGRCRGNGFVRREREDHRTDASRFAGGRAFLTLSTQLASAAIADAGRIQQTIRAIELRSAFLRIERMIGGTEQASIRLKRKSRSWKATRKRPLCPVSRAIPQGWRRLADWRRLAGKSRSEFSRRIAVGERRCPHSRRRFHTHWLRICQNSCPQGVCEHQRSGSCSLSSSARTVSKDPRCRYKSSTSLAEKAGVASLVTNNS